MYLACAAAIFLVAGCVLYSGRAAQDIATTFRIFTLRLREGNVDAAYGLMSNQYKRSHTIADFGRTPWCDPSNLVHATAIQNREMHKTQVRGVNPITGRARIITSTADIKGPLFLEDGLIAVTVTAVRERDGWRIASDVNTVMR